MARVSVERSTVRPIFLTFGVPYIRTRDILYPARCCQKAGGVLFCAVEMLNIVGEQERPNLGFARDVRAA